MTTLLEKLIADGRSTPGLPQKNDVAVHIRKSNAKKSATLRKRDD